MFSVISFPDHPFCCRVDLHKAFKRYGQVSDIQLPYNTGLGGKPKGYAFVLYTNKEVSNEFRL